MNPVASRNDQISEHFQYHEMIRSETASRDEIDNNLYNEEHWLNAQALAENCLEPIRKEFGSFRPNSWFRSERLEFAICRKSFMKWCNRHYDSDFNHNAWEAWTFSMTQGGDEHITQLWQAYFARKSHPECEACDLEINGIDNNYLFEWCKENLEFDQLIREFPREDDPASGWVHISWKREGSNRQQAFTIG